jgi:hypothetical protein
MLAYQKDKETKKINKIENKIIEKIFELIINTRMKVLFFHDLHSSRKDLFNYNHYYKILKSKDKS